MASASSHAAIPAVFQELPVIRDTLITETTELQTETVSKCLIFLAGSHSSQKGPLNRHGVPALMRDEHIGYLYDSLEDYPPGFVAMDASRPWMIYWALAALSLLGEDLSRHRDRAISTIIPMQNPTGGFGGGHGQISHCASSYAAVLSLAMVGGEEALNLIDRQAMWKWLGTLKQPDGGITVFEGGEEDVRGAYCAMVIISLLNLPLTLPPEAKAREYGLETFTDGLLEYLSRCQTFEGGISGSPGSEAHGAYAFCALACLCILGEPEVTIPKCMDVQLLLSWLSARQYAPEGGFAGRTNKLVDGCYSHWVGSCWPLIQSALDGTQDAASPQSAVRNLYSREGLTRYILGCCQSKNGGLRDKPGKHPDSYHTCYTLTGLSSVQHYHYHTNSSAVLDGQFSSAFSWKYRPARDSDDKISDINVFDEKDRLKAFHPLYVIPHEAAESMRIWCAQKPLGNARE
ncbi:CAAX farnesyltransferase subunit beta RAM1 [Aspergillus mulundensis]|uniref:Protein farnesyltransferase subunit beta n=1 Tax=Aspergillus mulundensis TaxID=1810919 RepID=A0A3D8S430_9EURO|nr:CaaX farnesyltransferase beta subunit [Aspergillus mulundensis]RDW81063.1 CaaX farnesyltransferase beta subunit [Aspergillus mulundensis]